MKNWENSIENLINEARGEDVVSIYEYHSKCSRGIGAPGKFKKLEKSSQTLF